MASAPKVLKTSTGSPIQVVPPTVYETIDSIAVSQHFPNVFEQPHASLSSEEKVKFLQAQKKYSKSVNLVARTGILLPTHLELYIQAGTTQLVPEEDSVEETCRVQIFFSAYHYRSTDANLAIMSMSVVDEAGQHIFTPEFETFKAEVGHGQACFVTWSYPVAKLWENKNRFFPDGTLRLKYKVGQSFSQEHLALPKSLNTLSNNMLELLKSGDKPDFTITCGSSEFKVHEIILACRSPVFGAMFSHNMSETNTRKMNITDVAPDVFQILLEFIYSSIVEPDQLEFKKLCELIPAADKYELTELKNICFNYISKDVSLENIGDISLLAYNHLASEEVQKKLADFVEENYKSLRKVPEFKEVMRKCLDMYWEDSK